MADGRFKEAIQLGNVYVVDELLNSSAININEITCDGLTPLRYAMKFDFDRECKELAQVNNLPIAGVADGNDVLFSYRDDDITLRLISASSDLHAKNIDGMTLLMMALQAKRGYKTICKLVDVGSDINAKSLIGNTPLMYAVKNKYNKKLIVDLISMGAEVNSTNKDLLNALFYAVKNNDIEVAEALLNAGANAHALDYKGSNILSYIQCNNCNEESCESKGLIDLLHKNGVDLKGVDRGINNSLIHVVGCNYLIDLCIRSGVCVNVRNNIGCTPLRKALQVKKGYETIYKLVDAGSDINVKFPDGRTPLMYVVKNKYNKKLIVHLISMGAEVNCTNENNLFNALFYAVINNDIEVAEALLNAGANAHALDYKGSNILSYIQCNNCNEESCESKGLIDLLHKNGVDLKGVDRDNNSLIHVVGCNYLIDLCIRSGVCVNLRNNNGCTPLIKALQVKKGYETIYKLVDAGSDINVKFHDGCTPLMYAVENDYNKKLIYYLISMGAEDDSTDYHLCNALFYTIGNNNIEIVEALLNAGANVLAIDEEGFNVFSYIRCSHCNEVDYKCKPMIDLLRKNGGDLKIVDNENNTLIHQKRCNYLIHCCICSGVSINAPNNNGCTPLMDALIEYDDDKVNSLLLFGADCRRIFYNAVKDTTLYDRFFVGLYDEVVSLLVYHGADLWVQNDDNRSILDIFNRHNLYICRPSIQEHMKHLLFSDEKVINDLFNHCLVDGEIKSQLSFVDECKKELIKMKNTYLKDGLSFFEFCNLKRFYKSKLVDISIDEYKYNFEQIEELFPIYYDIIVIRIKDNRIKVNKRNLLRSLENIVVKPIPVNNVNDSNVQLNYDCLYYMCRNFDNKQLQNFFLAVIE